MAVHLRVYPAPEEAADGETQEATVRVSLGELLPLVALAHRHNYVWLQDFLDDEVAITIPAGQRHLRIVDILRFDEE